jgi:hypothetical protein
MAHVQKGSLSIDPLRNPAVLNTHTWDPDKAVEQIQRLEEGFWKEAGRSRAAGEKRFAASGIGCRCTAPRALGALPRLGIGCRMTTSVWPAVWRSMQRRGYAANAIQNSLRELLMLEDVINGIPAHQNYLFSFGSIAEGHTGSTFEGLWTRGVLSYLDTGYDLRYGADADHIQVKRGPEGVERAKK